MMTLSPPILYAENNFDYGMRLRYKTPQRETGTDGQTKTETSGLHTETETEWKMVVRNSKQE